MQFDYCYLSVEIEGRLWRVLCAPIVRFSVEFRDKFAGGFFAKAWNKCMDKCCACCKEQCGGEFQRKGEVLGIGFVNGCRVVGKNFGDHGLAPFLAEDKGCTEGSCLKNLRKLLG